MAHAEEKLPAVNASFISTSFIGPTAGNLFKGLIWGTAAGVSQSMAFAYRETAAAATAAGKAVEIEAFKSAWKGKATTFVPSIIAHSAIFAAYRGSLEQAPGRTNTGLLAGVQPLLVVALPTLGFAAYKRAAPPQALTLGVLSAAVLHVYDRCWHPKGLMNDVMPTAKLQRRVW